MVTNVLFPESSKSTHHKLLQLHRDSTTGLEPYTTTSTLIELARKKEAHFPQPPRKRRFVRRDNPGGAAGAVLQATIMRCVCILGSWTRLAWSSASWTLLVCLLLARGRKGQYSDDDMQISKSYDDASACGSKSFACLSHEDHTLLSSLHLDGTLTFSNTSSAAFDFGLIHFSLPGAILYPRSVRDIQVAVRAVQSATSSGLTIAAKGRGRSVHGQAQVLLQLLA